MAGGRAAASLGETATDAALSRPSARSAEAPRALLADREESVGTPAGRIPVSAAWQFSSATHESEPSGSTEAPREDRSGRAAALGRGVVSRS